MAVLSFACNLGSPAQPACFVAMLGRRRLREQAEPCWGIGKTTISPALINISSRCKNDCGGHVGYNPMVPNSCVLLTSRTTQPLER